MLESLKDEILDEGNVQESKSIRLDTGFRWYDELE